MVNATALVRSFITPVENMDILFRIEFLVVLSTMLFLVMFILDAFRGHFHSSIVKAILSIVDSVSDSIVIYVMGVMQTAPFKNQLFPVWAIVLVGFRNNIDFISGYGIPDKDGRRFAEWRNLVKYLGVAFLNKTRGSMFSFPLWSLWAMQILRGKYRLWARNKAFNSVWHGKSSQLVSEYMRTDTWFENCKAETMEGYRYLVSGETWKHIILKKPRYVLQIDPNPEQTKAVAVAKAKAAKAKARAKPRPLTRAQAKRENGKRPVKPPAKPIPESLITLDKIWQCDGALLHPNGNLQGSKFKDLSLAFSLSRLLRCRLEDLSLHRDSIPITKDLVMLRMIREEAKRAFGVMELEMSFLNAYFNTRYPMVFWGGLHSLHVSSALSGATFAVACWLSVEIRHVYKTPKDEVAHVVHGVNIDMLITWLFMFFMMFKEIWEMVSYYLSDWARVLLASTYVRESGRFVRNSYMERFINSFSTSKIADKCWHGFLDQYAFTESYDESPSAWNFMHSVSTGAIPKKDEGAKIGRAIDIPECVKPAILKTLRSLDLTRDHLLDDIPSLSAESREQYRWACFELPTSSHIILVWHIATSLCEIRFAQDREISLSNPGFSLNALLYLTSFCRCFCCAPQPYLVDEKILDGDLKTRYTVANSLSRYCAYLLVSKPDLVPDSFLVPKIIFQETVKDARRILKDADSLDKKYKILIVQEDTPAQDTRDSMKNMNIVQQGAKLARQLMRENEETRWEILAGVWADLLVHTAPSWNAGAHKDCLESGGEFITHIWALFWHCGIEKSMLWPVESLTGVPRHKNAENNSAQPAQDQQQDAIAMESDGKGGIITAAATAGGASFANVEAHLSTGMLNLGNACYFDVVLQCLLALRELRIQMLKQNPPAESVCWEMKKLFEDVAGGANVAGGMLVTENLFSIMSKKYSEFNLGGVQDSNSLLGFLLDALYNEEPAMVQSLFRGQVDKHFSSKECEHGSVTTDVLDLSLAIPLKDRVSVEDCLDLYATGEVEGWYCMACSAAAAAGNGSLDQNDTTVDEDQTQQSESTRRKKTQSSHPAEKPTSTPIQNKGKLPMLDRNADQMEQRYNTQKEEKRIYRAAIVNFRVTRAPPILKIQLQRFHYDKLGKPIKLEEHVSFQDMLNITKFMYRRCAANDDYKYCLVAVIVHEGPKLVDGHNYSYVRVSSIGQDNCVTHTWFCANDKKVKKVSLQEVLKCQAYILFYERVELSKVNTNP